MVVIELPIKRLFQVKKQGTFHHLVIDLYKAEFASTFMDCNSS